MTLSESIRIISLQRNLRKTSFVAFMAMFKSHCSMNLDNLENSAKCSKTLCNFVTCTDSCIQERSEKLFEFMKARSKKNVQLAATSNSHDSQFTYEIFQIFRSEFLLRCVMLKRLQIALWTHLNILYHNPTDSFKFCNFSIVYGPFIV